MSKIGGYLVWYQENYGKNADSFDKLTEYFEACKRDKAIIKKKLEDKNEVKRNNN